VQIPSRVAGNLIRCVGAYKLAGFWNRPALGNVIEAILSFDPSTPSPALPPIIFVCLPTVYFSTADQGVDNVQRNLLIEPPAIGPSILGLQ
jgi:hypothetical protein